MAIRTVDASNVAEYVAERTAKGNTVLTPEQVIEHADRIEAAKKVDAPARTEPTPGNPIISAGEAETKDAPPDPGTLKPTAKEPSREQVAKAKAGTDPGVQKRLDELIASAREAEEISAEEYNNRLRAEGRVQELERELQAAKATKEPPPPELKEPDPNDPQFKTVAEFLVADRAYQKQVREREIAQARQEERLAIEMQRENELLAARIEVAKVDLPDFVEVIESGDRVKVELPQYVQNLIKASEVGPQIAYHLAKFPEEQKRILKLRPELALAELGKIASKYEKKANGSTTTPPAAPSKTPIETTRAPAPVTPVRAGETPVEVDLSKPMPATQYIRLRREQMRREGRRH
jgi:hypothetical protein